MSADARIVPAMHPWRALRETPDVRVIFVDLPRGLLGFCDHDKRTIWLTNGMSQRQRRAVLQHERTHLQRGRVCGHFEKKEELAVEQQTARSLISLPTLLDALKWSRDAHEVAAELWVPVDLLVVRMAHLHPAEKSRVRATLAQFEEMNAP